MARKKPFIIVAHIKTRKVELIIEGLLENKKHNAVTGSMLYARMKQLCYQYPPAEFDIVVTRSKSIDVLEEGFPEFHGWEKAKHELLS